MKGRLNSTLWAMVIGDVIMLFGVLWLAYSAGEQGKLPITDFGGLGQGPGVKLLSACFIAAITGFVNYVIIGNRVRFRSTMCVPPCEAGVKPIPPMPASRPLCMSTRPMRMNTSSTCTTARKLTIARKGS